MSARHGLQRGGKELQAVPINQATTSTKKTTSATWLQEKIRSFYS